MDVIGGLAGATGFLTRLPVGHTTSAWQAFCKRPWTMVVVGYVIGLVAGLVFVLPVAAVTAAVLLPVVLIGITGITHLDGLADLGDAAVIHGGTETRRAVLKDAELGVGGTIAVVVVLGGLGAGAYELAGIPVATAVGIVVAAEVAAKLSMALLACLGKPFGDGLGAAVTDGQGIEDTVGPIVCTLPLVVVVTPAVMAGVILAGLSVMGAVLWWANRHLDGINGDCFGTTNELTRVIGVHVGVLIWLA